MTDFELECGKCRYRLPATPGSTVCPSCGRPLLVRYDLAGIDPAALTAAWTGRACDSGMWRFLELLPLRDSERPVTLGEGATPLLSLTASIPGLEGLAAFVKDEGRNPTGSFKDRGLAAAVTRAALDGADGFVIPSAGNAGVSLAAYASRAGLPARIYLPRDTPEAVEQRARSAGGEVRRVDGLITECAETAREYARETGAFELSTLREPYRIEGKKTMMLEIIQSLGGRAPDAILYPTGGGTGLIGSWKALAELEELGIGTGRPRLYAVQAEGCAPIVRAFEAGTTEAEPWAGAATAAYGLRVPSAIGDFLILEALRASGGGALTVSDEEAHLAGAELTRWGISASIEGGAALAAARRLRADGGLADGETVVLFNTAHAFVYGLAASRDRDT